MPIIQASHPVFSPIIADCNGISETQYGNGVRAGNLITVSTAESFIQLPRFSGGKSVFKQAAVVLNTSSLPFEGYETMFGCILLDDVIIDPPEVGVWGGFGYIEGAINMNCEYEVWVTWIKRVIFTPPPMSAVSRANGSVTLTTPSVAGTAYLDGSYGWRERMRFSSPSEAIRYLECKAGICK